MNLGKETEVLEHKESIAELDKSLQDIVAILNKHKQGILYFGVKNDGEVIGHNIGNNTQRDISQKIYNKILPIPNITITLLKTDANLNYIQVLFSGLDVPYSTGGKYYFRVSDESRIMTQSQLKEFFNTPSQTNKDWELELTKESIDDIDAELLRQQYDAGFSKGRFPDPFVNSETALSKMGLIENGMLNNAGKLLFSKKEPIWLKMAVFATEQKITFLDMLHIHGNIFECIKQAIKYISLNIRWAAKITVPKRIDIPEIPIDAIREIVVNSFAHADYKNIASVHEINIYPSMITIFNPGQLPRNIDPEILVEKNLSSAFRNPKIAETLFKCGEIEAFATGFKRTFSLLQDENLKYSYENNFQGFKFTFIRRAFQDISDVSYNVLNDTDKSVLAILRKDGKYDRETLALLTYKTVKTVYRTLNKLQKLGYIKKVGNQKNYYWEVLK